MSSSFFGGGSSVNSNFEVLVFENDNDWDLAFKNVSFLSGKGAAGCVFKGKWQNKEYVFKVLFAHKTNGRIADTGLVKFSVENTQQNVKREAFIGSLLSKLPDGINNMFAATHGIAVAAQLPQSWKNLLKGANEKGSDCIIRQNNAVRAYVIIQDLAMGMDLDDFLLNSDKKLSGETIRSLIFQMVVALGVAQHEIGFTHNDLKLENVLGEIIPKGEIIEYIFNGDKFSLRIPPGGLKIKIIDFGASILVTDEDIDKFPKFREATDTYTPMYEPFDLTRNLYGRLNDSDMTAIFTMAINMLAHYRLAIPDTWGYEPQDRLYKHEVGVGFFSTYDDILVKEENESSSVVRQLLDTVYKKSGIAKLDETDLAEYEEQMEHFALYVLMAKALGMDLSKNKNFSNAMDTRYHNIYNKITDPRDQFQKLIDSYMDDNKHKLVDYFSTVPAMLKDAFGNEFETALHFFTLLFEPWQNNRLAFGVFEFPDYGFSNAIYHSFLSANAWDIDAGSANNNGISFQKPLLYRTNLEKVVDSWKALETKIDSGLNKNVSLEKTDSEKTESSSGKKQSKSSESEKPASSEFYSKTNAVPSKVGESGAFMMKIIDEMLNMYYPKNGSYLKDGVPLDVLQNMTEYQLKPLFEASLKMSKTSQTNIKNAFPVTPEGLDVIELTAMFTDSADESVRTKSIPKTATGFKIGNVLVKFSDSEDVFFQVSQALFIYFGIAQLLKGAKKSFINNMKISSVDDIDGIFPEGNIQALFKNTRTKIEEWKETTGFVSFEIMGLTLSNIEKQPTYHSEKNEFNLTSIKDNFLVPIYTELSDYTELNAVHSYINSKLEETPIEAMTRAQQIHLLHVLGKVALIIDSQDFSKERISQCLENQVINV